MRALTVLTLSFLLGHEASGQSATAQQRRQAADRDYLRLSDFQPALQGYVAALGSRLTTPGQERIVVTGRLQRGGAGGFSQVSVTWEPNGRVRLDEQGGRGRTFGFDGSNSSGRGNGGVDDDDEEILESLVQDWPDAILSSLRDGAAMRLVGMRFRNPGAVGFGSVVDIVELTERSKARRDRAPRVKHLMFDSNTKLLARVSYRVPRGNFMSPVETQLTEYSQVQGSPLPGKIVRLENGREIFRVERTAAALQARGNGNDFKLQ